MRARPWAVGGKIPYQSQKEAAQQTQSGGAWADGGGGCILPNITEKVPGQVAHEASGYCFGARYNGFKPQEARHGALGTGPVNIRGKIRFENFTKDAPMLATAQN
eukprot:s2870_g5.t1